jgi:peptidoglycan/xylan/chitin deacetylase (PgdA/CDA1 family)
MATPWRALVETYAATSLNGAVRTIAQRFPLIFCAGDPNSRQVALSYDDGPHPVDTPALLEVLARHKVTATFSWLGEKIEQYPDYVAAAAAAGHQLMIHGYRHRSFLLENTAALHGMLDTTRDLIARHSGRNPAQITCVRPPFGHLSQKIMLNLVQWGYQPVLCSIMPVHWMQPAGLSVRQVVAQVEGGALIVLHEALSGPPVAELTDAILSRLAERGWEYVTIDALREAK